MVPVTVHRYQYEAAFFRKTKPTILGVRAQALPTEVRQQLQRNAGIIAWVVLSGSPAFAANILEGDVILKFNGEDVISVEDYGQKLNNLAGQKIDIEIWRNGQSKTVPVQLNNKP